MHIDQLDEINVRGSILQACLAMTLLLPGNSLAVTYVRPTIPGTNADSSVDNIVSTARRVAEHYFADGGVQLACPPLRALLHIMRDGQHEGRDLTHPDIRLLFTRESLLASDWYRERLEAKQAADVRFWQRRVKNLEAFLARANTRGVASQLNIRDRLDTAWAELRRVQAPDYVGALRGTLGVQARLQA